MSEKIATQTFVKIMKEKVKTVIYPFLLLNFVKFTISSKVHLISRFSRFSPPIKNYKYSI